MLDGTLGLDADDLPAIAGCIRPYLSGAYVRNWAVQVSRASTLGWRLEAAIQRRR